MSIIWTVLSVLVAIVAIVIVVYQFIWLFNQTLLKGQLIWWIIGPSIFLGFGACLYFFGECVINKGPDDWGSLWHAGYPLAEKYGKSNTETSYDVKTFDKDPDGSGSGTYHVHFRYDSHTGIVLCHYNKTTGKFDRDEIVSDK